MRRIGRWVLNALTALSLLLCVGTCGLWARSQFVNDYAYVQPADRLTLSLANSPGEMRLALVRYRYAEPRASASFASFSGKGNEELFFLISSQRAIFVGGAGEPHLACGEGHDINTFRLYGFDVANKPPDYRYWAVRLPQWLAFILAAMLPALRVARRAARFRRLQINHCRACTYDLTGNLSGVCPECGTKVAEAK